MDKTNPGILRVSVKKTDKMITVKANKLNVIYKKLEVLPSRPTFLKAKVIANVAKYVNATSVNDINPNSCFIG